MGGHILTRDKPDAKPTRQKSCGNCRKAWSLGKGSNVHTRVCDEPKSPNYRRCLVPQRGYCEFHEPESPRDVIKQLMRTVGAT